MEYIGYGEIILCVCWICVVNSKSSGHSVFFRITFTLLLMLFICIAIFSIKINS